MMSRLATVQERGTLVCAINTVLPGFGALDADGNNVGFDIDQCRAVAAAVLGDANAVEFRQTTAAQRGPDHAVRRSRSDGSEHNVDVRT